MPNAFKRAAEKQKTSPGGLPEEITAGQEQAQEKIAVETVVEEVPVAKETEIKEEVVQAETEVAEIVGKVQEQVTATSSLAASYAERKTELDTRSVRLAVFITQSMSEKLNQSVRDRKIKSKNDLVNFLLEQYFESEK